MVQFRALDGALENADLMAWRELRNEAARKATIRQTAPMAPPAADARLSPALTPTATARPPSRTAQAAARFGPDAR